MSKAVLYSIQPIPCGNICNRKKTVEIRKTIPKLPTPFKAYIYCTQGKDVLAISRYSDKSAFLWRKSDIDRYNADMVRNGKVIGEFVCDRIDTYEMEGYSDTENVYQSIKWIAHDEEGEEIQYTIATNDMTPNELIKSLLLKQSCLTFDEIGKYVCGKKEFGFHTFYGLHISELVIYDKPKELSEFYRYDNTYDNAFGYAFEDRNKQIPLSRPPQSWCYVEELRE